MTSPEHLSRAGWRPGTLKPGDKITLIVHPLHNNTKGAQYLSGTGPNGPLLGGPPAHCEGEERNPIVNGHFTLAPPPSDTSSPRR